MYHLLNIYIYRAYLKRTSALDVRTAYPGVSGHRRGGAAVSRHRTLLPPSRRTLLYRPGVHRRPAAGPKPSDTPRSSRYCSHLCKIPESGRLPAGDGARAGMGGSARGRRARPSGSPESEQPGGGRNRRIRTLTVGCGRPPPILSLYIYIYIYRIDRERTSAL